jgi:type IV pilus assembly protein PilO
LWGWPSLHQGQWALFSRLSIGHKHVAHAPDGLDVARVCRVGLQQLSQARDLDVQAPIEGTVLAAARQQELDLRDTFRRKKGQAINRDAYKKQLADIEQAFGALLKQLPNKAEMEALLTDINQAGLGRGLQFTLFRPAQQETMSEFYAELPITIRVIGAYHDIGAFASDVSQLSRIVTLNDIGVAYDKEGNLTLDATAKTYRYLDQSELEAQKRMEKDAKAGAKKK